MDIVTAILVSIAISAISFLLAPKPKVHTPTAGSLDIPDIKDGSPIPVIFGEVWIKDPHVAFYGSANAEQIVRDGGKK